MIKIGDIIRVKTREELEREHIPCDWDKPEEDLQGLTGKIAEVILDENTGHDGRKYPYRIKFDSLPDWFLEDDIEYCSQISFALEEIIVLKYTNCFEIE